MSLRLAILIMSAFGVISDSILIAFYPQFFAERYGITSPVHVGAYIAAISIAVMCALPFWAKLTRRIETLHLLWMTQAVAGTLAVASAWAQTIEVYWLLTMAMFVTKASYLLLFPYLMRLEKPEDHGMVIGLLSVVIHIGAIFGASVGGLVLESVGPKMCMWVVGAGDFSQMAMSLFLIFSGSMVPVLKRNHTGEVKALPKRAGSAWSALLKLSALMLLFDLSAYLIRPFFSVYWQTLTESSQAITGLVFAIPGVVALVALAINKTSIKNTFKNLDHTLGNLLIGAVGLVLQATSLPELIVIGRCLFGWSLFQVIVKMEVTLFKISQPDRYDRDFAVTNFFQNLGVLLSSFAAGYIVNLVGIPLTFALAAGGFLITAFIDRLTFNVDSHHQTTEELSHAH